MKTILKSSALFSAFLFLASTPAEVYKTSQMIGFASGNLGAIGTSEGWTGSSAQVTVTNGLGSLNGVPLGLAPSSGEMAHVSAADGFTTQNTFAASGQIRVDTAKSVYYAYLYRFNDLAAVSPDGERINQVNVQNSGSTAFFTVNARSVGDHIEVGVAKPTGTIAYATNQIAIGSVILIVIRQQIVPGAGNDIIHLWINPGSLGAAEESLPEANAMAADGTEATSNTGPGRFYCASGANASFDELRIASTWAEVTPTPSLCDPPVITAEATNVTVTAGINARFSVTATGTSPSYRWQTSLDGNSWSNIANVFTPTYSTPNLSLADNGRQYRAIASVTCGAGLSVTSAPAIVTVTAPVSTPVGLVMADIFFDGTRNGDVFGPTNSLWFQSSGAFTLDAASGTGLIGTPVVATDTNAPPSSLWVGYFTDDAADPQMPVHLDVGTGLSVRLSFFATGVATTQQESIRFGLFDYADGATRIRADGFGSGSTGNGQNVRGYMLDQNFGATFTAAQPMQIFARNNMTSVNLMGTTGDYQSLGSGPPGTLNGQTAIEEDEEYFLDFIVVRTGTNSTQISTRLRKALAPGNGSWTHRVVDNTYGYHRFNAFAIRPSRGDRTAASFRIGLFKVQVFQAVIPFRITSLRRDGGVGRLVWETVPGKNYFVNYRDSLTEGDWITQTISPVTGASTEFVDPFWDTRFSRFYSVWSPDP